MKTMQMTGGQYVRAGLQGLRLVSALLLVVVVLSACGVGSGAAVRTVPQKSEAMEPAVDGTGPHTAASITKNSVPVAESGWLKLYLDNASKTVSVRSYDDDTAQWFTLPQSTSTPLANAGACALSADIIVNGKRITLNTQDHAVAFDRAQVQPFHSADGGGVEGVQVEYLLTPNAKTAAKKVFAKTDVAFLVRVQYTLDNGNFYVEATWSNYAKNPDAFIESIGLMERFGALRNPGIDDFLMLPDGGGALLYPGRVSAKPVEAELQDLRFAVYGDDPGVPTKSANWSANVGVYGVRRGGAAFAAVIEKGETLAVITAQQDIPGEAGIRQCAVGPRFTITPTTLDETGLGKGTITRAAASYGENGESLRICYRFFFGETAAFHTMATACREQLINIGVLSSTKTVRSPEAALPLQLTLLGTGPNGARGMRTLTTFDQAQDILTRLKNKGVDSMDIRYLGALRGGWRQREPERIAPLLRLGGSKALSALQTYCKSKSLSLFLDVRALPAGSGRAKQALGLTGVPLKVSPLKNSAVWSESQTKAAEVPLRNVSRFRFAARSILLRLSSLQMSGICIGDLGNLLYADYSNGGVNREQAVQELGQSLSSLSAQWFVMLDTGFFHVVRTADVLANLPLEPQVQMQGNRYVAVPLLPIILHGSTDYAGVALNLAEDKNTAFLRAVAYGACPAFVWSFENKTEEDENPLYFEYQLDNAVNNYTRANTALRGLRGLRITDYQYDAQSKVSVTTFGEDALLYVNYSDRPVSINDITIPAQDFVRIG